ncbi:MAG: hypothetical protein K9M10_01785 [Candidatus Pacebacteria bacterium]|nr:hypothetical protein [Candidatus Paceibacterota bacterium]MCF7857194.1 hypothetical protein [Candidatus Paceibacterota bacterium]
MGDSQMTKKQVAGHNEKLAEIKLTISKWLADKKELGHAVCFAESGFQIVFGCKKSKPRHVKRVLTDVEKKEIQRFVKMLCDMFTLVVDEVKKFTNDFRMRFVLVEA